jgi:hypothetical protein
VLQPLNSDSIITLGQNIAFLLCLPLVCHFLWQALLNSSPRVSEAITGIAFAAIAMIGMLSPVQIFEGLFVDGRVAILAVAGLYSTPTGIVAALLIASFRILLGGVGTAPAVATILTAVAIGIGARKLFSATLHKYQLTMLLVIGLALVLATAVWALFASAPQSQAALKLILVPILLWYPACTILLGNLFAQEFARQDSEKALRINSERFLSIVNDQLDPVIRALWTIPG